MNYRPISVQPRWAILAATCLTALALLVVGAGKAHAEERQFCFGANVPSGQQCGTAKQTMSAAYVNSPGNGSVCLSVGERYNCLRSPNEGLYLAMGYCGYTDAVIRNENLVTEKVYGVFWSC